jgi:hypothetical protein
MEAVLRYILPALSLLIAVCGVALADATVAGDWHADLGQGVRIDMTVTPNGDWSSETRQNNRLVRKMSGTYQQSRSGDQAGTLVFKPTETSAGSGSAQIETDRYELVDGRGELRLTADGDTMVFTKQQTLSR